MAEPSRAKPLLTSEAPALVPCRMVNEVLYCERLAYLEWAQTEFQDNHFTVEGRAVTHRRVDRGKGVAAAPTEEAPWSARSVWMSSERLGLTGKVDLVECDQDGWFVPVEYKRGRAPKVPEGAYLPERAQLCAQVLLLREHGYRSKEGWIWFAKSRKRVAIRVDDELTRQTIEAIARVREICRGGELPPPLEDDPKCRGCSLSPMCLPDEVHLLRGQNAGGTRRIRRLQPAKDLRVPLYLQEQGARVGVRGNLLLVTARDGTETRVRLPNTSQVCLMGNIQMSTQAIRALLARGVPVVLFSAGGWYLGRTLDTDSKNVELRVAQYRAMDDERFRLRLARTLVRNKIVNARTFLRRNVNGNRDAELLELKQLARKSQEAVNRSALLGIEGSAARTYFGCIHATLKGDDAILQHFRYEGRNRRPPLDPLNAALSFMYALLTKEFALALTSVGLDPLAGYYHEPRFGRPSLALDLMEPFRILVADSTVVGCINNGELKMNDFVVSHVGCMITSRGRKKLLAAYERRLAHQITHPIFGYAISYRRVIEVQCRLLTRVLLGELDEYPELVTR